MAQLKFSPAALTTTIVILVIAAVGSAAWYFTGQSVTQAENTFLQVQHEHNRLQNRANFPSQENLEELLARIEKLESQILPVRKTLEAVSLPAEQVVGTVFQSQFARLRQRLLDECQSAGIALPENFQFGFSLYATSTPVAEDTPKLGIQLNLVEHIVDTLVQARVIRIHGLRRMLVESSPPPVALETASGLRGQNQDTDFFSQIPQNESLDYVVFPFLVEFESDEGTLRRIVNHFSSPPPLISESAPQQPRNPYFVIRAVRVENAKKSLPTIEQLRGAAAGTTGGGSPPALIPGLSPGSIAPVIVVGNETIRVAMRLDYIGWKTTQESPK